MKQPLLCFALLFVLLSPVEGRKKPEKKQEHDKTSLAYVFRPADATLIADYYRSQPGGLPPGLAKRHGDLPPGLEKQLRRNGTLPPGLAKRLIPFPAALEARLPPCPAEVRRGLIGAAAVMWNPRTGVILDAVLVAGR